MARQHRKVATTRKGPKQRRRKGSKSGGDTITVEVKVDRDVLGIAMARTGISDIAEVINAGLRVLAVMDNFGLFLVAQTGRLSEDFDLAV